MELTHDNQVGAAATLGTDSASKILKVLGSMVHNRLVSAKAKEAARVSSIGHYFTLTGYQKSLIPVPQYAAEVSIATGIPVQTMQAGDAGTIMSLLRSKGVDPINPPYFNDNTISPALGISLPVVGIGGVTGSPQSMIGAGLSSTPGVLTGTSAAGVPEGAVDTPSGEEPLSQGFIKKYVLYIGGAAVLGLILYFVWKRK